MSSEDDKRQVLKYKQGLLEEVALEKPHKPKLKGFKRFTNFLYRYKIQLLVAIFLVAVVCIFIVSVLSKEKADLKVLLVSTNNDATATLSYFDDNFALALEKYCPDFNKDGKTHVQTFTVDINKKSDANQVYADQAKLYGELSDGTAQIFIGNKSMFKDIMGDGNPLSLFMDLSTLYPDDERIDGIYFKLKGTPFAELIGLFDKFPDLYLGVRRLSTNTTGTHFEQCNKQSLEVLHNIVTNNVQSREMGKPTK